MYNPHMTEKELRSRLTILEEIALRGELTPTSAAEMDRIKSALRQITNARRASTL